MTKSDFFIEYYREVHGDSGLKPGRDDEWRLKECPFCGDDRWKFYYRAGKRVGKCYICCEERKGYNVWQIIGALEDVTPAEARRLHIERALGEIRHAVPGELGEQIAAMLDKGKSEGERRNEVALPDEFVPVYDKRRGKWSWPKYLTERGFERKTAIHFKVGWCKGGPYAGRIVFPIRCDGQTSFVARWAQDQSLVKRGVVQKVKNPTDSYHAIILFHYDEVKRFCDQAALSSKPMTVYIVEGPTDVTRMWQNGFEATVGLFGKTLHAAQIKLLLSLAGDVRFVMMLDPDAIASAQAGATALKLAGAEVDVAVLSDHDPGEMDAAETMLVVSKAVPFSGGSMLKSRLLAKISKKIA